MVLQAHPAAGAPQTCTSQSDFSWPAVGAVAATDWDCADADSPGPDDHFAIAHRVTLTGDIVQDGDAPIAGITVAAGGELLAPAPLTLTLGPEGLVCQPGSTCRFAGAYREFGDPTPELLAAPDPAASFVVGDVIPCPDASGASDCSDPALRELVRFSYPSSLYGAGAPFELPEICASIGAVDAAGGVGSGDVLAFFNPDPSDLDEGPDTNFWYEIAGVDAGDPCSIDISVHQGTQNQDGYPLARREIAVYAPTRDVLRGERVVELANGALPAANYHDGRMLRMEVGGKAGGVTYRIHDSQFAATDDCADGVGPCDLLRIADHRGFATTLDVDDATRDEIWVDYGWEPGNPFLVIAPVRIEAAPEARGLAPLRLEGVVELRAVVFYGTDTLIWRAESSDGCEDVWLEDLYTGGGDKLHLAAGIDCERLSITGGDEDPAFDISHTIVAQTSGEIALRALGLRHGGDDFFSVISGFGPSVTFDRFRAQFKSTNAPSDECIATGHGPVQIVATDVECIDAVNTGAAFSPRSDPGSSFDVRSAALIAARGGLWFSTFGDTNSSFTDVTIIGGDLSWPNDELVPMNTDRFVVRDSVVRQGRLLKDGVGYARNGILLDNRVEAQSLAIVASDITLENVAFIRTRSPGANDFVAGITQPSTQATWRNILIVANAGEPGFSRLWRFGSGLSDLSVYRLGGLAFVGHTGPPATRVLHNQTAIDLDDPALGPVWEAPPCFFGNDLDATEGLLDQLPIGTLRGVDPEFVDVAADRYDVTPGSPWDLAGCGVRRGPQAPGVRAFQRYHAWSNLVPEAMSDTCNNGVDDDQDGEVDFPNDVGCQSAESSRENPQCQDGVDNDGDGAIDWDGAGQGPADPQCRAAYRDREAAIRRCGLDGGWCMLGIELVRTALARRREERSRGW